MKKLKIIIKDFIKIVEEYYMINFYTHTLDMQKLKLCRDKINTIYKKYNVKNYKEMLDLIEQISNSCKLEKDLELCSNILFAINNNNISIKYDDEVFKKLYAYIITNNLYNPNWNVGISEQPLFVFLTEKKELFDINFMVYNNPNIDWQILNNGTDSIMSFVYKYLDEEDEIYRNYYFEIIKSALTKINIESTLRYKSEDKKVCYKLVEIKEQIVKRNDKKLNELIKEKTLIKK